METTINGQINHLFAKNNEGRRKTENMRGRTRGRKEQMRRNTGDEIRRKKERETKRTQEKGECMRGREHGFGK